jgi:ribosomal protein S27AE
MKTDVKECARCGQDHAGITFTELINPGLVSHFAMCPVTNQPILMAIHDESEEEESP